MLCERWKCSACYKCELLFSTYSEACWDVSKKCPQMFFEEFTSSLHSSPVVSVICGGKETVRIIRSSDNWKKESWESSCFESIHAVGEVTCSISLPIPLVLSRMFVFENWEVLPETRGESQIRILRMCWIRRDPRCRFSRAFSFWSVVYCIYLLHGVPPLPLRYILIYRCCFSQPWIFVYATFAELKGDQ